MFIDTEFFLLPCVRAKSSKTSSTSFVFIFIRAHTHNITIKTIQRMATATSKAFCITCEKERNTYKCECCSQNFCANHLADHHHALGKQLDEIEDRRNLFRETLAEQKTNSQEHPLIQQINQWERDSIKIIRQTAEEARELLVQHTAGNIDKLEGKLVKLTEQLRRTRDENDVNEIVLNQFKRKLKEMEEELAKSPNISIREDSSSFVSKISVVISSGKCTNQI
jgi:hypothetical protein